MRATPRTFGPATGELLGHLTFGVGIVLGADPVDDDALPVGVLDEHLEYLLGRRSGLS